MAFVFSCQAEATHKYVDETTVTVTETVAQEESSQHQSVVDELAVTSEH